VLQELKSNKGFNIKLQRILLLVVKQWLSLKFPGAKAISFVLFFSVNFCFMAQKGEYL